MPTIAELKMLRLLQGDVNAATAKVHEEIKKAEEPTPEAEARSQGLGREQTRIKRLMESLTDPTAQEPGGERI